MSMHVMCLWARCSSVETALDLDSEYMALSGTSAASSLGGVGKPPSYSEAF